MLSNEYSEAITETLDILKHTRKEDVNKISSKFMDFLNINASKTYKPELDHTKRIAEMNLKHKTKVILAIIYKKFWCNNEEQEQFDKILAENDLKREKEAREKYNPNNIFKDENTSTIKPKNNVAMIEHKETIFERIINKLKNIFHIK